MKVRGHENRENKPIEAVAVLGSRMASESGESQFLVEIVQCSSNSLRPVDYVRVPSSPDDISESSCLAYLFIIVRAGAPPVTDASGATSTTK
jgi:hypothetical protein